MTTLILSLLACSGADPEPSVPAHEPALRRLTARQYENSVHDLFGAETVPPSSLEPDTLFEGLASLGAAVSSTSPLGVERYEAGAGLVADQVLAIDAELPCTPSGPGDADCMREWLTARGRTVWRRPLASEELDRLVALGVEIGTASGDFHTGARYALSSLLQSPHFLYRAEHGGGEGGPLTEDEIATRLSFFLWNGPPDAALLDAAAAGQLTDPASRAAVVDRMIADPRFRRGVRDYFGELLKLDELDHLTKEPSVFPHASAELWASAKEQTLREIEAMVVDDDRDYRELFRARRVWVDARLAALYEIPAPALEGFGWADLPADGGRQGLLGHASVLGLHAHATSSSATRRGAFVRGTLLCQGVPPPPADVDTSIPEADANAPTLRDRLQTHQEVETCAACHRLLDPVGLALENFDGVGRWRTRENDVPIDASGELDGITYTDGAGLGDAVANHPNLATCATERLLGYALGHPADDEQELLVDWLTTDFVRSRHSVRTLMRTIALSDAFATGGAL